MPTASANEMAGQSTEARLVRAKELASEIKTDFLGTEASQGEVLQGYVVYPRYVPGTWVLGYGVDTPVDLIVGLLREDPQLAGFNVEVTGDNAGWIHIGWFS